MASSVTPKVGAFNIELPTPNFVLNVQDYSGNLIEDADITIDCDGDIITGKTDVNGCFSAVLTPGVTCTLTIGKDCFHTYEHKFKLIPKAGMNSPDNNFPFFVENSLGQPFAGAGVIIVSPVHQMSGFTDGEGKFEGIIKTDFANNLTIASGSLGYQKTFFSFIPVKCLDTDYRIAPVITLE